MVEITSIETLVEFAPRRARFARKSESEFLRNLIEYQRTFKPHVSRRANFDIMKIAL